MREGGVAAPPSATSTSIRPLPPAVREAAGSTDGISRGGWQHRRQARVMGSRGSPAGTEHGELGRERKVDVLLDGRVF
jgi:hypothetical protein